LIRSIIYSLLFLWALPVQSQYYLRGEVKDEKNRPLSNVRIFVHSSRSFYQTGAPSGTFGINERVLKDSLTLTFDGYETLKVGVITSQWQTLIMKPLADISSKNRPKLISLTKDYALNISGSFKETK
jgi:Ca-activated chloride channel family protein